MATKRANSEGISGEVSVATDEECSSKKKLKNDVSSFPTTSPINSESEDDGELIQPTVSSSCNNKRRKKRVKSDSEPEEGELPDSDSSSSSEDEFNDGYASDLMGDEEDRMKLRNMTEKERELELCRRADARDELKKRFEIEKRLRQSRKLELKKQSKNNYSEEEFSPHNSLFDIKERVLERKKNVEQNRGRSDKKLHAMSMLKARREEKKEREEKEKILQREKQKQFMIEQQERLKRESLESAEIASRGSKTKLKASDVYSDDSSDDENDKVSSRKHSSQNSTRNTVPVSTSSSSSSSSSSVSDSESDTERGSSAKNRIQYVSSKDQLNSIRLSRQTLEKFVHLPFFSKVAVGSFVRITSGNHTHRPLYKICQVIDVCEAEKVYQLGNTRTNKGLKLKHGNLVRVFRMEFISNQEFTSTEFDQWSRICSEENISLPTVEEFQLKLKEIQEAQSYEFKEEDVEKIVKEKEKFKTTPYNFAVKKTQLLKEREVAQSMGDSKKLMEIQDQLCQLEEQAMEHDKRRNSGGLVNISYINNMNRRKNVEEAEKAILAELKASRGQRADDPFTRRHTKPSMLLKAKKPEEKVSEEVESGTLSSNSGPTDTNATELPYNKSDKASEAKKNPQKQGEDMYAAHDFEIKIDFDVPSLTPPVLGLNPVVNKPSVPTTNNKLRSLNLEDYKRRRGFI